MGTEMPAFPRCLSHTQVGKKAHKHRPFAPVAGEGLTLGQPAGQPKKKKTKNKCSPPSPEKLNNFSG